MYGRDSDIAGPNIQAITSLDAYPVFQNLNWAHNNSSLNFDCYFDGTNWKSSYSGSNFQIWKVSNKLAFNYKSGITAGGNITWTEAMNISTAGLLTANAGITTTTLTTSDNIVVGAGKKIFVDRSALANNKLVLWDGETGSTTAFLGFGINNNTLIYNVNTDDSHVFYHSAATELFRINNTAITASKSIILPTTSSGSLTIRQRPNYTMDPQIFFKSGGFTNYGIIISSSGLLHAWTTSNSTGEPSGTYNYIPLNGAWTNSSDRRLKQILRH